MENKNDYLLVKEAAKVLGVCSDTLRAWDAKGKVVSKRHPINNYRLYKKEDIERLKKKLDELYDKS